MHTWGEPIQRVEALVFGAVECEERAQADPFLELTGLRTVTDLPFLSEGYVADNTNKQGLDTMVTKCPLALSPPRFGRCQHVGRMRWIGGEPPW